MDIPSLVQSFLESSHGQQAAAALQQQGISAEDAQNLLTHAATAGAEHVETQAQGAGLLGEHPGKSFFAAFAAGLVKGDGLVGSLEDGAEGVLASKITEVLLSRAGVDASTASTVVASPTPFIAAFFKSHLGI
jgi:hypothetical protein